jgi:hypothetical protein
MAKRGNPKSVSKTRKRHPPVSEKRLERALRFLRETGQISVAARSIRISQDRFKRIAVRRKLIRKSGDKWVVAKRLHRKMLIYSDGAEKFIEIRAKAASEIGKYMSAVGEFRRTNNLAVLKDFRGAGVFDVDRQFHAFEMRPNVLYRVALNSDGAFEEIYRIVI